MSKKQFMRRLLQMILVLLGISFLTFLLTYLAPGDPVRVMFQAMGIVPSPELLEATRERMGLNDPMLIRYARWLLGCLHGDFGNSYSTGRTVISLLMARFIPTLKLAGLSLALLLLFSLPLGMISAVYKDKPIDYVIRAVTFLGVSVPNFWIGTILLLYLGQYMNLFPVIASTQTGIRSMFLPAFTLAFTMTGKYTRQVRSAILEELGQDYVIGARAMGLSENVILWKHVFPNALLPLSTWLGIVIGSLLGGTSVVEVIFTYPGLGTLAISAIKNYDYPLIQGYVLLVALLVMLVNLLVDVSYILLDPRIREKK